MKTTKIEWHPYPEEKPPGFGMYEVTQDIVGPIHRKVLWLGKWDAGNITAWAYPIEPYRREK